MHKLSDLGWERWLFVLVGLALGSFGFYFLYVDNVTAAVSSFALGFFSFFYSNLARFRRFKGFGLEAEMWEDKQKEAAELIERLRGIVEIYSREILLTKVQQGRWGDGKDRWGEVWNLYAKIGKEHTELNQSINIANIKREMDLFFLFDMVVSDYQEIRKSVSKAIDKAHQQISTEFGNPITDIDGHKKKLMELRSISSPMPEPFELAKSRELASRAIELAELAEEQFKERFTIDIDYDSVNFDKLRTVAGYEQMDSVPVSKETIDWANHEEKH